MSEIGHAQARQAAALLPVFAPTAVYSSPLARTLETAAHLARALALRVRRDSELGEWHRTESLYEVGERLTCWLVRWLRSGESCAVAVSHASPILAVLRSALYLPHVPWWKSGQPDALELSSSDRFEVTMASVFELVIEPRCVTARCVFHPQPRIHHLRGGRHEARPPRPVVSSSERRLVRRPNLLRLLGYRMPDPAEMPYALCSGRR